jgi:hypothetical protein
VIGGNAMTASTLVTSGNINVGSMNTAGSINAGSMNTSGSINVGSAANPGYLTLYTAVGAGNGFVHQNSTVSLATYLAPAAAQFGSVSNHPLQFFTNNGGAQMTISTSGNIGIGTASPNNLLNIYNTTGGWGITLNNINNGTAMNFLYSGAQVGTITINGSNTAYNTSSDRRLKTNINYQFDGLGLLQQLKPCSFNFIADGSNANTYHGFIAQDVQEFLPQYIQTSPGMDWLMMDYKQLTGILAKAILQQNTTITSLQTTAQQQATEITALQATVATQSTQVLQTQVNAQQIQIAQLMQRLTAAGIA